jgi:hypothetical protein
MKAAATESSFSFSRFFFFRVSCINCLALSVVRLSSRYTTGIPVLFARTSVKPLTFAAWCPIVPSIVSGRPATIVPASFWLIRVIMASISWSRSVRSIIVRGLAMVPPRSLSATPILLSPMSSPRIRVRLPLITSDFSDYPGNLF